MGLDRFLGKGKKASNKAGKKVDPLLRDTSVELSESNHGSDASLDRFLGVKSKGKANKKLKTNELASDTTGENSSDSALNRFLGLKGKKSNKAQPTSETEMETADSDLDKFLESKARESH